MKMNIKILFWFFIGFTGLSSFAQERHLKIIEKCIEKRKLYATMTYRMELSYKMFHTEDTLIHEGLVELIRRPEDSIYSGLFSIELDSLWYGYDGERIMMGSKDDLTLTVGDPHSHPGLFVQSTWVNNFLDYGFLKLPPGPTAYINNSSIGKVYKDTMIEGWPCISILFSLPDEQGFYNQRFFVAIDTVEYIVRSRMYSAFFQENEQYTKWVYKDVKYGNNLSIKKLDGVYESSFQRVERYSPDNLPRESRSTYNYAMLEGRPFNTKEIFRLKDVDAKLVLLDFWYTSCYPCIKGIPAINRIAREYRDKGVEVFGINMIDDEEKSKARLEKFFKNNQMEYTPIMVNPNYAGQIGIRAYPTLIILDKDFNVIYMEDGFSENLYEKIAGVLNANL